MNRRPPSTATITPRYRSRPLLAGLIAIVTAVAIYGVTRLSVDDNLAAIIAADNPDYRELLVFFEDFGEDDRDCVFVLRTGGTFFIPQRFDAIRGLVGDLQTLPAVESVQSILDVRRSAPGRLWKVQLPLIPGEDADQAEWAQAEQLALRHPLVAGHLLSEDGSTMLVVARLRGRSVSTGEIRAAVAQIQTVVARYASPEMQIAITGLPQLRADIYACIQRDQIKFTALGASVALAIAICLFRRPAAVLIVAIPPMIGTLWTLGLLGLSGESINTFNSILPALVLVVGVTDSVHFMMDIRRQLQEGHSPRQAAKRSMQHMFLPISLTAVTTAVGFGSLVVAQIEVIQRFGLACAAGALCSFLAVICLVPLLACTRLGQHICVAPDRKGIETVVQRGLTRVIDAVTFRARRVAAIGVLLTAVLAATALRLEPDNTIRAGVPRGTNSYRSLQQCDAAFGGAVHAYLIVQWPADRQLTSPDVLRAIAEVHRLADEPPEMGPPLSILNLLAALPHQRGRLETAAKYLGAVPPEVLGRFVRIDLRKTAVRVPTPDLGARAMAPVYRRLEERLAGLEARYPGFEFRLTGTSVVASRNVNQMIIDLSRSLGLASLIIFGVITLAFRSLRYGVISVLPNVVPLASAAVLQVIAGGSLQVAGVVTFSICLGVAVDDTIHFISRFDKERRSGGPVAEAIRRSVGKVGSALVVTSATLLGGFGVGLFSRIPAMQWFSLLSCVALITALAADIIILPALLACFGPRA